jgi:transcriptional regulator with XRE-family HTH domain
MEGSGSGSREFGELLREYRRSKYSQEALANAIGKRTSTIQDLETNRSRVPYPETLNSICKALDLNPAQREELIAAAKRRREAGAVRTVVARDGDIATSAQPTDSTISTDGPDSSTRDKRAGLVVNAFKRTKLTVVVCAVILVAVVPAIIVKLMMPPASEATILSPVNGQRVESPLTVTGTTELPPDSSLWLLVRPIGATTYYLTDKVPVVVNEDGTWASRLKLGRGPEDEGYKYDLFVLIAPNGGVVDQALANKPAEQFSARFTSIPNDSEVTDRIRVELARFVGQ